MKYMRESIPRAFMILVLTIIAIAFISVFWTFVIYVRSISVDDILVPHGPPPPPGYYPKPLEPESKPEPEPEPQESKLEIDPMFNTRLTLYGGPFREMPDLESHYFEFVEPQPPQPQPPPPFIWGSVIQPQYQQLRLDPIQYQEHKAYSNFVTDFGDTILLIPELTMDGLVALLDAIIGDSHNSSVTSRLLAFEAKPPRRGLFNHFTNSLVRSEYKFFKRFGDSELNTIGVQDGTQDIDDDLLEEGQRKVLWDTVKRTYFSKYKLQFDDRIRDEAFYLTDWQGADFVALPPLVTGYLWYRGFEKKFSHKEFEFRVALEPIDKWVHDDDLPVGLGVSLGVDNFPIRLIATTGLHEGELEFEFIGIGTSIGMVERALILQAPQER
jgi:hypothetical protein